MMMITVVFYFSPQVLESVYAQLEICLSTLNKTPLQSLITLAFKRESLLMMSFAMNFSFPHFGTMFPLYFQSVSNFQRHLPSENFPEILQEQHQKNCVMNCSSFRCRLRPPNIFFYKKGDVNVGNCRSFPLAINRLNWGSSLFPSSTLIRSGIEAKPKVRQR